MMSFDSPAAGKLTIGANHATVEIDEECNQYSDVDCVISSLITQFACGGIME